MAGHLDRIVDVKISRGSANISIKDFGTTLYIGRNSDFFAESNSKVVSLANLEDAKRYLAPDNFIKEWLIYETALTNYKNGADWQLADGTTPAYGKAPTAETPNPDYRSPVWGGLCETYFTHMA